MYNEIVEGTHRYTRGLLHPAFLPTDEQAEVLIPDQNSETGLIGCRRTKCFPSQTGNSSFAPNEHILTPHIYRSRLLRTVRVKSTTAEWDISNRM